MKLKLTSNINDDWVEGFIKSCEAMDVDPQELITEWVKQSIARMTSVRPLPKTAPVKPPVSPWTKAKHTLYKGVGGTAALGAAGTAGYQIGKRKEDNNEF